MEKVLRDRSNKNVEKVCNQDHCSLYSSPNIVWMMKWRQVSWKGYIACREETKNVYNFFIAKSEVSGSRGKP